MKPRRVIGGIDAEAERIANIEASRARRKAGIAPEPAERIVKPAYCGRCLSDNCEKCDGGAWDICLEPVPCACSMEDHTKPQRWGGSAVVSGGWDDVEADRHAAAQENRHWNEHGGAA